MRIYFNQNFSDKVLVLDGRLFNIRKYLSLPRFSLDYNLKIKNYNPYLKKRSILEVSQGSEYARIKAMKVNNDKFMKKCMWDPIN